MLDVRVVRMTHDFNGDSKSDYAVCRLVDNVYGPRGTTKWFTIQNGGPSGADVYDWTRQWGISSDAPVPGDYNADGNPDFAVHHAGAYHIRLNLADGPRPYTYAVISQAGDRPVPGHFDGDGRTDLVLYRPDVLDLGGGLKAAGWYVWNNTALGTSPTVPATPPAGNNPVPVDYNAA